MTRNSKRAGADARVLSEDPKIVLVRQFPSGAAESMQRFANVLADGSRVEDRQVEIWRPSLSL